MNDQDNQISALQKAITDEAFRAMGFSPTGWIRRIFGPLLGPPTNRFAQVATSFERDSDQQGIIKTIRDYLPRFVDQVTVCGTGNIPLEGPLIIASNHPGTLDGFVIISSLPREDFKLIISGVPFVQGLPALKEHLIYTTGDPHERMGVVRTAIRHLENGGLLITFPTGQLDPDPAFLPGAAERLGDWSSSLEIFLRRVPQSKVLPTIVSGVFATECLRNPLTRLRKEFWHRQRIAEYIQVIQMIFFGKKYELTPKISFGEPVCVDELLSEGGDTTLMKPIIERARHLLAVHTASEECQPGEF
jgi:hypothetical protein